MIKKFNRILASLLAIVLLLSTVQLAATVKAASTVPDGEYEIGFRYVKDGATTDSVMQGYVVAGTGKLIISEGEFQFQNEFKDFTAFKHFSSRIDGNAKAVINGQSITGMEGYEPVATSLAGDGTDADHVIARMSLASITQKQDVLIHIAIPAITYDNWYNVQLELDTSTLPTTPVDGGGGENGGGGTEPAFTLSGLNELITAADSAYGAAAEGTGNGFYPVGSKGALYNAITSASGVASNPSSTENEVTDAYTLLDTALKNFQALRIVVNKNELESLIAEAEALYATMKLFGETRGTTWVANVSGILSEGEYPTSPNSKTRLNNLITSSKVVKNNIQATQAEVDKAIVDLTSRLDETKFNKLSSKPIHIMALDSVGADAKESPAASYFNNSAVLFQSGNKLYSHIKLYNYSGLINSNEDRLRATTPIASGELTNASGSMGADQFPITVNIDTTADTYAAQLTLAASNDNLSSGIVHFKYKLVTNPTVTQSVYLTFNVDELTALQDDVAAAQLQYDNAETGTAVGQYDAADKAVFQAAIDAASSMAYKLASTRPHIAKASAELKSAVAAFEAAEVQMVELTDGNYYIDFRILKYGTDQTSVMQNYVKSPALLKVSGETKTIFLTVTQDEEITGLKYNGSTVAVHSRDTAANTRIVYFNVTDLSAITDGWVKIDWAKQNYHHEYDVQFSFDESSIEPTDDTLGEPGETVIAMGALEAAIASAQNAYEGAVEGTAVGQYKAGSRAIIASAIEAAKQVKASPASQQQVDEAETVLKQVLQAFRAAIITDTNTEVPVITDPDGLADGNYYIDYSILKFGTNQTSVMQGYVVSPALLKVSGSSKKVYFTIKQSKEITALKFNNSNVSVASSDTENNTRVVFFSVNDLSSMINGWVQIDWPEMDYHHQYDIQLKFNKASITSAGAGSVPGINDLGVVEEEVDNDVELLEPIVTSFGDIQGHWAQAAIEKALLAGIAKGYTDGKFHPDGVVTRSEFAVFLSRALKLKGGADDSSYNDQQSIPAWAQTHVARAGEAGLLTGYSDQTFRPNQQITRVELAAIIARAAKLATSEDAVLSFTDAGEVPSWAVKDIAAATQAGLILGKGDNRFDPNAKATRAEALTLIFRLLGE